MKSIYLDSSTLSDAFKARSGMPIQAQLEYSRVASAIDQAGGTRAICVSHAHLAELTQWRPPESALGLAQWLDELSPVWLKVSNLEQDEIAWWVGHYMGRVAGHAFTPLADNRRDSIDLRVVGRAGADVVGQASILEQLQKTHGHETVLRAKDASVDGFAGLRSDREAIPKGTSLVEVEQRLNEKFDASLREAGFRLGSRYFLLERKVDLHALRNAVTEMIDDPASVPLNRLMSRVIRSLGVITPLGN